jgi:hypothetical protein
MLFHNKTVNGKVVGYQLLIQLLGAEFLLALVLKKTNYNQHQKEYAEKVEKKAAI